MAKKIRYQGDIEPKQVAAFMEAIQKGDLRNFITLNIAFPPSTTRVEVFVNVAQETAEVFNYALESGSLDAWQKAFTLCPHAE